LLPARHKRQLIIFVDFNDIPTEDELLDMLPNGVDYVSKETALDEDIEWLCKFYNLKKVEKINKNVYKIDKQELIESLKNEKKRRVKIVKGLLENKQEEDVDLWLVSYEAYNRKGFFFYFLNEVINEIDLLKALKNLKIDSLYVVASFDYHF